MPISFIVGPMLSFAVALICICAGYQNTNTELVIIGWAFIPTLYAMIRSWIILDEISIKYNHCMQDAINGNIVTIGELLREDKAERDQKAAIESQVYEILRGLLKNTMVMDPEESQFDALRILTDLYKHRPYTYGFQYDCVKRALTYLAESQKTMLGYGIVGMTDNSSGEYWNKKKVLIHFAKQYKENGSSHSNFWLDVPLDYRKEVVITEYQTDNPKALGF